MLAAPERSPAGYRLYSDRDLERPRLIARAKDLGCSLEEIAELSQAWDTEECGPVKHRLRTLVHHKVIEVEAHLAEQTAFADQLRAAAAALAGRPLDGPCDDSCGCTATTSAEKVTNGGCGSVCGCGAEDQGVPLGRRVDAEKVPIVCSLSETDMDQRTKEWQRILDDVTRRLPLPGGLRLELRDSIPIVGFAAVVEAEQRCCPFFSFAITVDRRGLAVEVTAPADGQDLLATVFGASP